VFIPTPRQRRQGSDGTALALADYVAPSGYGDHVGLFAVTVGERFVERVRRLRQDGNQYDALLMQSLGDRLAEATAEWLHERVRRELWGYAPDEQLSIADSQRAFYSGIRPAIGYPSMPNLDAIFTVRPLIGLDELGITLTENGAMSPSSSVCGLYIASPHARYFDV